MISQITSIKSHIMPITSMTESMTIMYRGMQGTEWCYKSDRIVKLNT